ncbi:MAG: HAMP domain-containing protein [Proteobacteria bacterium]|nr:MAG: HAMP domain-containing protein [Pseudomonadota bacterium]
MSWFLVLSLVPLMFVTGYSLVKYEQAIDNELVQRLRANSRESVSIIEEFEKYLNTRRIRYKADPQLSFYMLTNAIAQARAHVMPTFRNSSIASLSLFNRDGQLVATITQDDTSAKNSAIEDSSIYLSDAYKKALEKNGQMTIAEVGANNSLDLVAISRLDTKNNRNAGYVEEIINIGPAFLQGLKKRLNLEILLFDDKGQIITGSHPDFALYDKSMFKKVVAGEGEAFFDLTVRNEPFGFIVTPVKWGGSTFMLGLGASKQKAKGVLRNINYAFFTMICAIGIIFVVISIFATRVIVRPVLELVEAIQLMEVKDGPVEIPVSTDTELGVLTESFNDMSRRIYQTKMELEKKITEVEKAYSELKETQARLVHTAKMASLGQMVAGIAHELNNPIGFIYSNMSHLRDYSAKLREIIEAGEKDPAALEKAKEKVDYAYIVEDLPRLITSCEDGAKRTRDIVLGLRNFSRLEEAKIKKVSLKEGIENTLKLLSGELKNRVKVTTHFEVVPEVLCYASQLNQVFMNILTNAAQAIEGDGEIIVRLSQSGEGKRAKAVVSIKDSGKGIPKDGLEKIFDPFYTTKSIGQGTGLGLSISYGIVKQHGGDIQVRSELGKGTEFIVSVPIEGPPGAKPEKV